MKTLMSVCLLGTAIATHAIQIEAPAEPTCFLTWIDPRESVAILLIAQSVIDQTPLHPEIPPDSFLVVTGADLNVDRGSGWVGRHDWQEFLETAGGTAWLHCFWFGHSSSTVSLPGTPSNIHIPDAGSTLLLTFLACGALLILRQRIPQRGMP